MQREMRSPTSVALFFPMGSAATSTDHLGWEALYALLRSAEEGFCCWVGRRKKGAWFPYVWLSLSGDGGL